MTNKDITKIYFQGNEIVALYRGDTLIFKKSGVVPPSPTGKYTVRGTVTKSSGYTQFNLTYNNGQRVNVKVNEDLTFETELQEPLTNARELFKGRSYLETLDLKSLDTSNVTDMKSMFNQSIYLKDIKLNIDTSNVTDMSYMFFGCERLETLDLSSLDTSNVTNINYMFTYNSALEDLYMNFNVRSVSYYGNIFYYCKSLKNVVGKFEGTKFDLDLFDCPLTASSAMVFINGLATVTEKRTLKLSATTYNSLTKEQIAIATSKGWTVTRG